MHLVGLLLGQWTLWELRRYWLCMWDEQHQRGRTSTKLTSSGKSCIAFKSKYLAEACNSFQTLALVSRSHAVNSSQAAHCKMKLFKHLTRASDAITKLPHESEVLCFYEACHPVYNPCLLMHRHMAQTRDRSPQHARHAQQQSQHKGCVHPPYAHPACS